jgi:hypothetical protein
MKSGKVEKMLNKLFEDIGKADIEGLVAEAVRESRTLDYKEMLPGNSDDDKKEFLYDVSSFANASGGFIIYGVRESRDASGKPAGIPEAAEGLCVPNVDTEILRLESIIRSGIDPRIPSVRVKEIAGFKNGSVIILRVGQSWALPHMVIYKNASRFYSRNSAGKQPLDVREIRAAFALSESVPERIRRFRDERLARIVAEEMPVEVRSRSKFALHIMPVSAVDPSERIEIQQGRLVYLSAPRLSHGGLVREQRSRYNLDGFLVYDQVVEAPNTPLVCRSYAQLFRSGTIEAVAALDHPLGDFLSQDIEVMLIQALQGYVAQIKSLALQPPFFMMLTLLGVKGYRLWVHDDEFPQALRGPGTNQPFDKDVMLLPDIVVENLETPAADLLLPALDALWQAGGWERCLRYDKNRVYVGRR